MVFQRGTGEGPSSEAGQVSRAKLARFRVHWPRLFACLAAPKSVLVCVCVCVCVCVYLFAIYVVSRSGTVAKNETGRIFSTPPHRTVAIIRKWNKNKNGRADFDFSFKKKKKKKNLHNEQLTNCRRRFLSMIVLSFFAMATETWNFHDTHTHTHTHSHTHTCTQRHTDTHTRRKSGPDKFDEPWPSSSARHARFSLFFQKQIRIDKFPPNARNEWMNE